MCMVEAIADAQLFASGWRLLDIKRARDCERNYHVGICLAFAVYPLKFR